VRGLRQSDVGQCDKHTCSEHHADGKHKRRCRSILQIPVVALKQGVNARSDESVAINRTGRLENSLTGE
jgi:hypothetical protein